ncbi:MAG TPA: hypothetical protein VK629_08840 [Steroidobacteraceae bacterium]|nr:hypothetical protein [Steroidobacteraceae bacterium]
MQTLPFRDLLDESLDEAHFLWRRWEQELASLTRSLDEIYSWTEDRLHGALDGVRVASDADLESLLGPSLAGDVPHHAAVAAHLLCTSPSPQARALLTEAVRSASGPKLEAMTRGFELAELDGNFAPITAIMLATGGEHRALLCSLKAFRRATLGQELVDTYESKVPALQARAIRAAAFLSSERVDAWIKAGLESDNAEVRTAAIVTGIRRRNTNAWQAAVQLVRMAHEEASQLLPLVAMFGSAQEQQAVLAAVDAPAVQKSALQALGALGTRAAAERCIQAMRDEALARLAGEAYCAITGAELERDRLDAAEKNELTPAFEDDNLDADLVPQTSDTWPLPNVEKVEAHWSRVQSRFAPDARYIGGRQAEVNALTTAIEFGPMLRRPEWLFEIAVRTHGQFDIEPRSFAAQQRRMLAVSKGRAG